MDYNVNDTLLYHVDYVKSDKITRHILCNYQLVMNFKVFITNVMN